MNALENVSFGSGLVVDNSTGLNSSRLEMMIDFTIETVRKERQEPRIQRSSIFGE